MFKYTIHRKSPDPRQSFPADEAPSEFHEDWLTSDAIGAMACYLPPRLLLLPFLADVAAQNPHAAAFTNRLGPLPGKKVDVRFWPWFGLPSVSSGWSQTHIEPDVLLEWDAWLAIFIEAKFRSDVKDDPEQLTREMLVGLTQFGLERFFLILITKDLIAPRFGAEVIHDYLARRIHEIGTPCPARDEKELAQHVLWTNWQTIYRAARRIAEKLVSGGVPQEWLTPTVRFLNDLLEVLKLRDLVPFQILAYLVSARGRARASGSATFPA